MKKVVTIGIILVCVLGIASLSYAATCNYAPQRNLDDKKAILEERVSEGVITQEEADEIEAKLENCDGTRQEIGKEYNVCFGNGNGDGYCPQREDCPNYEERQNQDNEQEKRQGQGKRANQGNGACDSTGRGTGICKRIAE